MSDRSKIQLNEDLIKSNAGKIIGRVNKNVVVKLCGKCGEPFNTVEKAGFIFCESCIKKKKGLPQSGRGLCYG